MSKFEIKPKVAVTAIRMRFPKFDKSLYSKTMHSDRYGVILHPEAVQLIAGICPLKSEEPTTSPKRHKSGKHLLTREIRCRLPDADIDALKIAITNAGYATVQDWMSSIVRDFISKGCGDDVVV